MPQIMVKQQLKRNMEQTTYRVAIRYDHSTLDIDVHIPVSDLKSINELANVDVSHSCALICVRVLADLVRRALRPAH